VCTADTDLTCAVLLFPKGTQGFRDERLREEPHALHENRGLPKATSEF
jgi:hypothetical protein